MAARPLDTLPTPLQVACGSQDDALVHVALRKGASRELAESLGEVHSHTPSRLLPHVVTLKVPAGRSREDFLAELNAHEGEGRGGRACLLLPPLSEQGGGQSGGLRECRGSLAERRFGGKGSAAGAVRERLGYAHGRQASQAPLCSPHRPPRRLLLLSLQM